jgi:GNAT superfamily N-acetyltransferase
MSSVQISPLSDAMRPLLNKFYRDHDSPMRAGDGDLWVARGEAIIGGLSVKQVSKGYWLTGLFVDPAYRGQGIARQLVAQARAPLDGPLWLFCHPDLQGLYESMGFSCTSALPQAMAERLVRYRRNKAMIAMGIEPLVSSHEDLVT